MLAVLLWVAALLPAVLGGQSTVYFPILAPSPANPWVLGQKNLLAWRAATGTGIPSFDVQLHNVNLNVMVGFARLALRVPLEPLPGAYKNLGGSLDIELDLSIPAGSGYIVSFIDSLHGGVFSLTEPFDIVDAPPANVTDIGITGTATATITQAPDPTMPWAITLNGERPATTKL